MDKIKPLFTATAINTGGRNGHSEATDGTVKFDLSLPKVLGGPGKPGTSTPEHLFACGYAACFAGAIEFAAQMQKKNAASAKITCAVTLGKTETGNYALAVKMTVEDKQFSQAELAAFAKVAHENICPYSRAIRNNVAVDFTIIGA